MMSWHNDTCSAREDLKEYFKPHIPHSIMIVQVDSPPSSILLQRRVKQDTDEEFLLITQINGARFTKLSEFDSYFNEVNKGGESPGAIRRIVDSNFIMVPMRVVREFLAKPD